MQVLCIVTAQGGGRCSTIHMVEIAEHFAEGCCTATTTIALTSIKQKDLTRLAMNNSYDNSCFHAGGFHPSQTHV